MTGSLRHIGGDRYKLVVYAGRDQYGRPRQRAHTFHATSERAAKRAATKHAASIMDEVERDAQRRATVAGLVDLWREHRDARDSPSTVRGRRAYVTRIRDELGDIPTHKLTARHLDNWYTTLRESGRTDSTIANHHTLVRAIVRQGWKWGECDRSAVDAVAKASPPRPRSRRPQPPTWQALDVLLRDAPPDLAVAAHLAAATGMRRGEILGLRWGDIHGATITVARSMVEHGAGRAETAKSTKTGEPRTVTVGASTLAVLAAHRVDLAGRAAAIGAALPADGPVLADYARDPSGMTPRRVGWLTLTWRKHAARHGTTTRFHDLRHWHATELLDQGIPVATVQHRLGHSKATTTLAVYTHAVAASDDRAVAVVEGRLGL
jgi:integrase